VNESRHDGVTTACPGNLHQINQALDSTFAPEDW
jgi:hypothetical protein